MWSSNLELSFYQQDEDICLAEKDNIELLLEFIDNDTTLPTKKAELLSALCILIYDNASGLEENDIDIVDHITAELKKRISLFSVLNTNYISDYVKEIVYPKLGLSF